MTLRESRVARLISRVKNNPVVASAILLGTIVIAFSTFTDAARNLLSLLAMQGPERARIELSKLSLPYTPEAFLSSAEKGDVDAVTLFLTAGMKPDAISADDKGESSPATALKHAAHNGDVEMINALLKAKADVNYGNADGGALSWALFTGKESILRILLDNGADVVSINGAFFEAARGRNQEAMRLLAERGTDLKKVGPGALVVAVLSGNDPSDEKRVIETINLLLDLGIDINAKDNGEWTVLLAAARQGYAALVRVLLDRGADVNFQCDCPHISGGGWTPLLLAIHGEHLKVVEALLSKGADVNQRNKDGESALLLAARQRDGRIFQAILDRNVDVNEKAKGGRTALMVLATGTWWTDGVVVDHSDAVRALLQKGAQVNEKDNVGRTALMLAAQSGSTSVVGALLGKGARVNDKDADGKTPLDFARKGPNAKKATEVIQLLQNPGVRAR